METLPVRICTADLSISDCHAEILVASSADDVFALLSGTTKLYLTPRCARESLGLPEQRAAGLRRSCRQRRMSGHPLTSRPHLPAMLRCASIASEASPFLPHPCGDPPQGRRRRRGRGPLGAAQQVRPGGLAGCLLDLHRQLCSADAPRGRLPRRRHRAGAAGKPSPVPLRGRPGAGATGGGGEGWRALCCVCDSGA